MPNATKDGDVVNLALDDGKIIKFTVKQAKGVIAALGAALKKKESKPKKDKKDKKDSKKGKGKGK